MTDETVVLLKLEADSSPGTIYGPRCGAARVSLVE